MEEKEEASEAEVSSVKHIKDIFLSLMKEVILSEKDECDVG